MRYEQWHEAAGVLVVETIYDEDWDLAPDEEIDEDVEYLKDIEVF